MTESSTLGKRKTMTESSTLKRQGNKRGNTDFDRSVIKNILENFTCLEDMVQAVKPYVSEVIGKGVGRGYQNARQVLDDYIIFNSLRTILTKEKYKVLVEPYAAELIFYHALEKKAMMLRHFSTMLSESDATLPEGHKKWIRDQEDAKELLSYALMNIEYWDNIVSELDKNVQSEIKEEKKRRGKFLQEIHLEKNEFQADNFVKKKEEFEELNRNISSMAKVLDELSVRSTSFYWTLWNVGDRSTLKLEKAFFKLLTPAEEDLAILWSEATNDMEELVQKEEEQEKKAREICEGSWSRCY